MAATNSSTIGTTDPVMTVNTADLAPTKPQVPEPQGQAADPAGTPSYLGVTPAQQNNPQAENSPDHSDDTTGVGVDGEDAIWEARYSKRNFIGRVITRFLATIAWGVLAYYTWGVDDGQFAVITWIALGLVVLFWGALIWRMIQAHYSHFYRLTNRRLFVSTGVVHRRRDMMELLRVKDVFTRQQSLMDRWLGLGTVVVVPTEKELPTFYLAGVDDPKGVMDLIWHHARAERDHRSVKVDSV